jgi:hypothetical protein
MNSTLVSSQTILALESGIDPAGARYPVNDIDLQQECRSLRNARVPLRLLRNQFGSKNKPYYPAADPTCGWSTFTLVAIGNRLSFSGSCRPALCAPPRRSDRPLGRRNHHDKDDFTPHGAGRVAFFQFGGLRIPASHNATSTRPPSDRPFASQPDL